jgi:hypothetical protein
VTWPQALAETASRLQQVIDQHGPQAVAFYRGLPEGSPFDAQTAEVGRVLVVAAHAHPPRVIYAGLRRWRRPLLACNRLSTSTARRRWPSTPPASC